MSIKRFTDVFWELCDMQLMNIEGLKDLQGGFWNDGCEQQDANMNRLAKVMRYSHKLTLRSALLLWIYSSKSFTKQFNPKMHSKISKKRWKLLQKSFWRVVWSNRDHDSRRSLSTILNSYSSDIKRPLCGTSAHKHGGTCFFSPYLFTTLHHSFIAV